MVVNNLKLVKDILSKDPIDKEKLEVALSNYKRYFNNEMKDIKNKVLILDWISEQPNQYPGLVMSKKSMDELEVNKWHALMQDIVKDGTMKKIFY